MKATTLVLIILILLLMAGCVSTEQIPDVPDKAYVGVATACVKESDLPEKLRLATDIELMLMSDEKLVFTIARERLMMKAYILKLEAVLQACVEKAK